MPGVGLIRSKLRPSRWLSPKSKQSFTKRRLLITVSSKSFSARCANSVSKCSSDRHRESANAPVENIPKVPYLSAIPVEGFLFASQKGAQLQGAVITVDEWGLLSNRSGHALLRIAKEHGALVRFVGDTRQHVAVEAGDFGRTLEQHSNLRSVSISKISRQRDPEYRAAVMEMASSKVTEGLARLG